MPLRASRSSSHATSSDAELAERASPSQPSSRSGPTGPVEDGGDHGQGTADRSPSRSASSPGAAVGPRWAAPTTACCRRSPVRPPPARHHHREGRTMRSHPPRAIPPAPPRVAIYARVSSDQQAERHTIDSQPGELTARASRDGHPVPDDGLFVDNGHSGASLARPALERLRDLAAVDPLDVHAPDRLARSYAHQVVLLEEFARAGTAVVFL